MIDPTSLYPQLVALAADECPDRIFIQDVRGPKVTNREAHERALEWCGYLQSLGAADGVTVAVMLPTSIEFACITLGLAWSSAIEVPVNTAYKGRILEHLLTDSDARIVIVAEQYLPTIETALRQSGRCDTKIVVIESGPRRGDCAAALDVVRSGDLDLSAYSAAPIAPRPSDTAWILYTSGTTGPSKGVLCTWAQTYLTATGVFPMGEMTSDDVYYSALPMFHVAGRLGPYKAALLRSSCVIRDGFSVSSFWDDIRTYRCTTTQLFPAMARFLYDQPAHPSDSDNPLRNVLLAPLVPYLPELTERFRFRVCTTWNMTETSPPVMSDGFSLHDLTSCGRARDGYELRIADELDNEVPDSQPGELLVRTAEPWALMAGYFGQPQKTNDAWRNLWFHTGDVFTRDADGNYYFVDRVKDVIRHRGENISSFEVEAVVAEYPEISEAAAVAVPADEGEEDILLFVVPVPDRDLDPGRLATFLQEQLPKFMVPRYVDVVTELPKTPTFRVQKGILRERGISSTTWDLGTRTAASVGASASSPTPESGR